MRENQNKTKDILPPPIPNKDRGLYGKYILQKADGSKMAKYGQYFVLRTDFINTAGNEETMAHRKACRKALMTYAIEIEHIFPKLFADLMVKLADVV